ncbi:MAG: decarboxylating 6-phosphogluconate dehydrogenase [Candidatus Doudnabacteria bacterium]|nr:decarboxylating 6-phosphogluconate dehydrogenase [Candidatus Doudnabacteria bacterium]
MQLALFGLGKMGMQIAKRLHKNGFEVLAWNRSPEPRQAFVEFGGKAFETEKEVIDALTDSPRVFWIMLPNDVVEEFIFADHGLQQYLREGDIVIDGGNSFYKDSVRRANTLREKGIHYFDSGTSGGVWGEKNGFALMVGGPANIWPTVEPIFKTLSSGSNYGLVGDSGAGHFVKMVHNGIEYGMMEAIAEGYSVMHASPFKVDLPQVTKIYQEGSVVRSWLIDLMANIFANEDIENTTGLVRATGEGEWTINAGKELGVDVRVIEASLQVRRESEQPENQDQFRNKILALLRKQFGGHAVNKK